MKKIVIAGGTGFIGQYLRGKFREKGYEVLIVSRGGQGIQWDNTPALLRRWKVPRPSSTWQVRALIAATQKGPGP